MFFTSVQIASKFFSKNGFSLLDNSSRSDIYKNVQNERAAIIEDDVRRGLGMLPQRAIFEKASEDDFSKMSEPAQVYTACQFVHKLKSSFCYFELLLNLGTSDFEKSFDPTCSQFGNK